MRAPASSGSPCRSVAAGRPLPAGYPVWFQPPFLAVPSRRCLQVPLLLCGSDRGAGVTVRGRVSTFGEGVWVGGVCACAPANELAMTSNPAREILFIGKFQANFQTCLGQTSVA